MEHCIVAPLRLARLHYVFWSKNMKSQKLYKYHKHRYLRVHSKKYLV